MTMTDTELLSDFFIHHDQSAFELLVESTVQSGLEVLKVRPALTQYFDRSPYYRPWHRRATSILAVIALLVGIIPVLVWSGGFVDPTCRCRDASSVESLH